MNNSEEFNDIFSAKVRLGIMTLLITMEDVDFSTLKTELKATDGNLGAHMRVLEEKGYVVVKKAFFAKRPKTSYRITDEGRRAFLNHLNHIEKIILAVRQGE